MGSKFSGRNRIEANRKAKAEEAQLTSKPQTAPTTKPSNSRNNPKLAEATLWVRELLPYQMGSVSQGISKPNLLRKLQAQQVNLSQQELETVLQNLKQEGVADCGMIGPTGNRELVWVKRR